MKKIYLFTGVLILIGWSVGACNKATILADEKQIVVLNSCREAVNGLPGTRICLDSVVADARCPRCVWEGYAIVKVSFSEAANSHHFSMSLWQHAFVLQQFKAVHDTIINGYKISFNELSETNKPPSEVKAVFSVTR